MKARYWAFLVVLWGCAGCGDESGKAPVPSPTLVLAPIELSLGSPRAIASASQAGIALPLLLPDQRTCVGPAPSACNDWRPVGSPKAGSAQLVGDRKAAQLYVWQEGATMCLYLYRFGRNHTATENGIHCYNTTSCAVYSFDDQRGPRPDPTAVLADTDVGDCSTCHTAGPILPMAGLWDDASKLTSGLNARCAALGGPRWLNLGRGAAARDQARRVETPADCGGGGCHAQGFVAGPDLNFCESVVASAFKPDGSMCSHGYAFADDAARSAFAEALGGEARGCTSKQLECNTHPQSFTLSVQRVGTGSGSVSGAGQIDCGDDCVTPVAAGKTVVLNAKALTGSTFLGWSGPCQGIGPCTVKMTKSQNVGATFSAPLVDVKSVSVGPGAITSSPAGIDCGVTCRAEFGKGTPVTLTATASKGSVFVKWSGPCAADDDSCVVNPLGGEAVTATFAPAVALATAFDGNGTGSVESPSGKVKCSTDDGACTFPLPVDTTIELTANPSGGSTFAGWSGGCKGPGICRVTMSAAATVTARFTRAQTLNVSKQGDGAAFGTVLSSPAGVGCGGTCAAAFAAGTVVVLTASAGKDAVFAGWSGACTGTSLCVVSMGQDLAVLARFDRKAAPRFNLVVTRKGTGAGGVTSAMPAIDCGSVCEAAFAADSAQTLTARAVAGSAFVGWSGACTGLGPCTVRMDGARTVTATFDAIVNRLSVLNAGSGAGTVRSAAPGIDCGKVCVKDYPGLPAAMVTLQATAAAGSRFLGWSGDCAGSSCTLAMTQARSVTATFGLDQPTGQALTINISGPGSGDVQCNGACASVQATGSVLQLTAVAANDSTFGGWSGDCQGVGVCSLTMDAPRHVTATFAKRVVPLAVSRNNPAGGSVSSSPAGIACGAECAKSYPSGTVIHLNATPAPGWVFTGWAGGCTGVALCYFSLTQAAVVSANFAPAPKSFAPLNITFSGPGAGTVSTSEAGGSCSASCTRVLPTGTTVSLTANPAAGVTFVGWAGSCSGKGSCTIKLDAAATVFAQFGTNLGPPDTRPQVAAPW